MAHSEGLQSVIIFFVVLVVVVTVSGDTGYFWHVTDAHYQVACLTYFLTLNFGNTATIL